MYKVIKSFTDMQDGYHLYNVGDEFPRDGMNALPSRIKELSTPNNRRNEILIQELEETKSRKTAKKKKDE